MAIRADLVVRIIPRLISAAGVSLRPNGLLVTKDNTYPAFSVTQWTNADDVADAYGELSPEYRYAAVYFRGYTNSETKPRIMYIGSAVIDEPAFPWVNGGRMQLTLEELKLITDGVFNISLSGTEAVLTGLDFSGVTSFSEAGLVLQAALQGAGSTFANAEVTYSSRTQSFRVTVGTETDTITFASGSAATALRLEESTGAMLSQGSPAVSFGANMQAILNAVRNFVTITPAWEPGTNSKLGISKWGNDTSDGLRFVPVIWDTDIKATDAMNETNFGAMLQDADYMGTAPVYNTLEIAAFAAGIAATFDPDIQNGRATFMGRNLTGLQTSVDTDAAAIALAGDGDSFGHGYNFYGDYATANDNFKWFSRGAVSGPYKWLDTHICAILIKSDLQYALMNMIQNTKSVPYNREGYAILRNYLTPVIERYINFGAIRKGVSLSEEQKTQIINETGVRGAAECVERDGYYLYLPPASAAERQARTYNNGKLYYADGGSIQQIQMTSTTVL